MDNLNIISSVLLMYVCVYKH